MKVNTYTGKRVYVFTCLREYVFTFLLAYFLNETGRKRHKAICVPLFIDLRDSPHLREGCPIGVEMTFQRNRRRGSFA